MFKHITNKTNVKIQPLEPESYCTKISNDASRNKGTTPKLNNFLTNSLSPKRVDLEKERFMEA